MKKFHVAIATHDIEATVSDYSQRFGCEPCVLVAGEYALWRTESLNVSVRHDTSGQTGELRHLGWEDSEADTFSSETDVNGILWERFSVQVQAEEIEEIWPGRNYSPESR